MEKRCAGGRFRRLHRYRSFGRSLYPLCDRQPQLYYYAQCNYSGAHASEHRAHTERHRILCRQHRRRAERFGYPRQLAHCELCVEQRHERPKHQRTQSGVLHRDGDGPGCLLQRGYCTGHFAGAFGHRQHRGHIAHLSRSQQRQPHGICQRWHRAVSLYLGQYASK